MKKKIIIISVVILLLAVLLLVGTQKFNREDKKAYIEFGYNEPYIIDVMGYIPQGWKYKINENGDIYYCTKKYGGETFNDYQSEEYNKRYSEYTENFVKKIDQDTYKEIEEYIKSNLEENADTHEFEYAIIIKGKEVKQGKINNVTHLEEIINKQK